MSETEAQRMYRMRDMWRVYRRIRLRRLRRSKVVRWEPQERRSAKFFSSSSSGLFLGIFLLFTTSLLFSSSDDPCANLPAQPGDDQKVEISVGEMRTALCYADAYDAEKDARLKIEATYQSLLIDYSSLHKEIIVLQQQLKKAHDLTALLGGIAVGTGAGFIIMLLLEVLR
jgi:hypothetical protein